MGDRAVKEDNVMLHGLPVAYVCCLKYVFSLLQRTLRMSARKSGHNVSIVSVSAGLRTYKVCRTFSCTWSLRLCVPLWEVSVLKLPVLAFTQTFHVGKEHV